MQEVSIHCYGKDQQNVCNNISCLENIADHEYSAAVYDRGIIKRVYQIFIREKKCSHHFCGAYTIMYIHVVIPVLECSNTYVCAMIFLWFDEVLENNCHS